MTPNTFSPSRKSTLSLYLMGLAVVLVYNIPTVSANYERFCHPDAFQTRRHGMCGAQLVDNLQLLCERFAMRFMGKYVAKRAFTSEDDETMQGILVNKKDAMSFLSKRESYQNIICECCVHRCSPRELMQYCEIPSVRRVRSVDSKSAIEQK